MRFAGVSNQDAAPAGTLEKHQVVLVAGDPAPDHRHWELGDPRLALIDWGSILVRNLVLEERGGMGADRCFVQSVQQHENILAVVKYATVQ